MVFPELIENWNGAMCAADAYPTAEWHNEMVIKCTVNRQGLSREEAQKLLHSQVLLPSRSSPPLAPQLVERYISRGIDYFYSVIATTAVRVYLRALYDKGHQGVNREATDHTETRFTIKMTQQEAARLSAGNLLIHDHNSLQAVVEATVAVCTRFGAAAKFTEAPEIPGGKPGLVCLLGHVAVVCTMIFEHVKRVAGIASTAPTGVNPGHREPWRSMLAVLDVTLTQRGETSNGLRLVDGDRTDRGQAPDDVTPAEWAGTLDDVDAPSVSARAPVGALPAGGMVGGGALAHHGAAQAVGMAGPVGAVPAGGIVAPVGAVPACGIVAAPAGGGALASGRMSVAGGMSLVAGAAWAAGLMPVAAGGAPAAGGRRTAGVMPAVADAAPAAGGTRAAGLMPAGAGGAPAAGGTRTAGFMPAVADAAPAMERALSTGRVLGAGERPPAGAPPSPLHCDGQWAPVPGGMPSAGAPAPGDGSV